MNQNQAIQSLVARQATDPAQLQMLSGLFGSPASTAGLTHLAGDVVPFPAYPGLEMDRRIGMQRLKGLAAQRFPEASPDQLNSAFDKLYGAGGGGKGATILNIGPAAYQQWLENQGMVPE